MQTLVTAIYGRNTARVLSAQNAAVAHKRPHKSSAWGDGFVQRFNQIRGVAQTAYTHT